MNSKKISFRNTLTLLLVGLSLISLLAVLLNLPTTQVWLTRAFGQPANIIIDLKGPIRPLFTPWKNLAQGGEAADYSFSPISNQLKNLSPDYIRIDHIYDFYDIVQRDQANQLTFDWHQLDSIISQILAVNAKPFISLSYMPPVLSGGDITGKPHNWSEWTLVVQKTIEHISGTNALNLHDVYYEVWNEPDLFGGWKTYGSKNYLTLYQYASIGAQKVQNTNSFKFGGPATTALYKNWVDQFLNYVHDKKLRLDFYSFHQYAPHLNAYESSIEQYNSFINQHPEFMFGTELILSEWGINSDNHSSYDDNISAAHLVATVSQLIPRINKAFIFEIQDGKNPQGSEYWGRWGLLTHQDFGSHPKPRYQAIQMLNRLQGLQLLLEGEGSWVKAIAARVNQDTFQLLLTNYDYYNAHTETVPITIRNILPGAYRLTTEFLGRSPQNSTLSATTDTINTALTLPANSVALLTFSRQ